MKIKSFFFAIAVFLAMTSTAFAEAADCSGGVTGVTSAGNVNTGRTSFNAHTGPNSADNAFADLSIALGAGTKGFAPPDRGDAACAKAEAGTGYDHVLKGWSWNDNLGFISFSCSGGKNNSGGGDVACGSFDYGVKIGPAVSGVRQLFGHAWSPSFGYVQFDNNAGDTIDYGVSMAADGKVTGYAWTQAGVYLNFTGIKIELPQSADPDDKVVVTDWCNGKPFVCVGVTPDPRRPRYDSGGEVIVGTNDGVKLADCSDGFRLHLYLRAGDGVTPMSAGGFTNYTAFIDSINLVWQDTVKADQRQGVAQIDVSGEKWPFPNNVNGKGGGVWYKPLDFATSTGVLADFIDDPADADPSHFISRYTVRSCAPTSESNISFTTGTRPVYPVNNEKPVFDIDASVADVTPNELILKRVEFGELRNAGGVVFSPTPVYPNGRENLYFRFKPAIEVGTLYVNDFKDELTGFRSIPENVRIGLKVLSTASNFLNARNTARATLKLGYDSAAPGGGCEGSNSFTYNFLKDLLGDVVETDTLTTLVSGLPLPVDVKVMFELIFDGEFAPPCDVVKSPHAYSVIEYEQTAPPTVRPKVYYYSNHLPRIAPGSGSNPAAVIHGNIYAQKITSVQKDRILESSGFVNKDTVRDSIFRNIKKYLRLKTGILKDGECQITALASGDAPTVSAYTGGTCTASYYDVIDVGDEKVVYFKGSDVTMKLTGGGWSGDWVVIADGGNIFVDNNIYNADGAGNIVLIALHDKADTEYVTGNVYIGPCSYGVRNIQGAIFADGVVFSYNGDHNDRDLVNNGAPVFDDEMERLDLFGCQLKIEGSVSSDNTIGGADLDAEGKDYLLIGGGRVKDVGDFDIKMLAQSYDINYLRLFKLGIETEDGLPVDQKCRKELTYDDIRLLEADPPAVICGDRTPCDPGGLISQKFTCDGINPLKKYNQTFVSGSTAGPDGDLKVIADEGALAAGLNNDPNTGTQFDPLYIFYDQTVNDSFILQGAGGVQIGNPDGN